ncbi:MAG: G5 domain-containing protein [Candidatus Pelethousia sp.]|nr:G5 domain-containing protein [Candidatus Pelethousia sp.]
MVRRRRKSAAHNLRVSLQRAGAGIAGFFLHIVQGIGGHMPRRSKRKQAKEPVSIGPAYPLVLLFAALLAAAGCFGYAITRPDPRIPVMLAVDGIQTAYQVRAETVGGLLEEAGVQLHTGDCVSPEAEKVLTPNMQVQVTRAYPVVVKSGSQVQVLHMSEGTVGEALTKANVRCSAGDVLSRLPFEDVEPGMQITHTDVDISYQVSYKTLEYDEITIKDDSKYEDYKKVEVEGADGKKQVTQRITVKDGIEVSREVADQVVVSAAVDQVTRVGTKIKYQTSYVGEYRRWKEAPVAGENGWVKMTVDKITAYCTGSRTATGTTPKLGTIAVNTYYIKYGSQIYIKGYGYGKAEDTGAFRNYKNSDGDPMNQLDLWFNSEKEARRWGTKYNVTVWVKK